MYNEALLTTISAYPSADNSTPEQSGDIVAAICRALVETVVAALPAPKVKRVQQGNRRRSKYKKSFSTEMHLRQTFLHFYTTLIRIAFPSGKRRRVTAWSEHTHRALLLRWLTQWTTHHAVLHSTMPLPSDLPPPNHILQMSFNMIDLTYLQACRTAVKKSLHFTARHNMRRANNSMRSHIDIAYQNKKLGRVIQLLTGQPTSHCSLNTLHCPSEGHIVDHYKIHCRVTEFFHDWYQVPHDLDPAADSLTSLPDWWRSLLHVPSTATIPPLIRIP
jgi:hypothetical protein